MSAMTFLWIEDCVGKAGYTFWTAFMRQLCPQVIVESKRNNSELVKAVQSLEDTENKYMIVCDNSFDNLQVVMERKRLRQLADQKTNIVLMDVICFEYVLLEFQDLIKWIYAPEDEFLKKRANIIKARDKLLSSIESGRQNYKDMKEIIEYDDHIEEHNIEQLSAKILFDLTRNTGFEVSKGSIGECWVKSCCEWEKRMSNDICGLDFDRMTVFEKMKNIYERTSLKEQFSTAGLGVIL